MKYLIFYLYLQFYTVKITRNGILQKLESDVNVLALNGPGNNRIDA